MYFLHIYFTWLIYSISITIVIIAKRATAGLLLLFMCHASYCINFYLQPHCLSTTEKFLTIIYNCFIHQLATKKDNQPILLIIFH